MQVSVEDMLKPERKGSIKDVKFFSLKKDGEFAIVRFLHTDKSSLDVVDVHNIKINNYTRSINCIQNSGEECPMCTNNKYDETTKTYAFPKRRKIYLHMLKYTSESECEEVIWERSRDYISKIAQYIDDYGDLCDRLFKIVRHGAEGSTSTTYDIIPLDKDRFVPTAYKFDRDQLNYKKAIGFAVFDKTAAEMQQFVDTGAFPARQKNVTPRETTINVSQDISFDTPRKRV